MTTYLRVAGRLEPTGRFRPTVGWETEKIAHPEEPTGPYEVELFDRDDELITRIKAAVLPEVCGPLEPVEAPEIVAYVPFDERASRLRLVDRDLVLYETTIAEEPPVVEIERVQVEETRLRANWQARHTRSLSYNVAFFVGRSRAFTLALDLPEPSIDLDIGPLPGGEACYLGVVATDGTRSSTAVSEPFAFDGSSPFATITSPLGGERFADGQPLSLIGLVIDASGDALPDEGLIWYVDREVVDRGTRLTGVAYLPPGHHEIRLEYEGNVDQTEAASVGIEVDPPTAEMIAWRRASEAAEAALADSRFGQG